MAHTFALALGISRFVFVLSPFSKIKIYTGSNPCDILFWEGKGAHLKFIISSALVGLFSREMNSTWKRGLR
jgi:hypothetical protein